MQDQKNPAKNDPKKLELINKLKPKCKECGNNKDKTFPPCFCPQSGDDKGSKSEYAEDGDVAHGVLPQLKFKPAREQIPFNREVIQKLLENKMSLLNGNKNEINLQYDPNELTPAELKELNKFTAAILKEWENFRDENGLSVSCQNISRDRNNNITSLIINFPSHELYTAFLHRLMIKNLLPSSGNSNQFYSSPFTMFQPSPLSMKPVPSRLKYPEDEKDNKTGYKRK